MDAQHPADANGVESPVVNQTPNRLWMDAELVRDIAHADQAVRISFRSRHAPLQTTTGIAELLR